MKMEGGMTEAELESYLSFAKAAMEGHYFYGAYCLRTLPHPPTDRAHHTSLVAALVILLHDHSEFFAQLILGKR
jgi:hypothetical protein